MKKLKLISLITTQIIILIMLIVSGVMLHFYNYGTKASENWLIVFMTFAILGACYLTAFVIKFFTSKRLKIAFEDRKGSTPKVPPIIVQDEKLR